MGIQTDIAYGKEQNKIALQKVWLQGLKIARMHEGIENDWEEIEIRKGKILSKYFCRSETGIICLTEVIFYKNKWSSKLKYF